MLPAVLFIMSIKICDFKSHGYKRKGSINGTWLFEKTEKVGQPLHLIYNVKEQWMRLRYPRSVGFYSVIIAKIKISNKAELDFVFDRISHDAL